MGETVTVYGRTFFLTDCDSFTRDFYTTNFSRDQGGPLPYPDEPIDTYRATFGGWKGRNTSGEWLEWCVRARSYAYGTGAGG